MPAGIRIVNTANTVSIDSDNPTLQLKAKYTVTVPSGAGRVRSVTQSVPNCDIPVFAIRPHAHGRYITSLVDPSGSTRNVIVSNFPDYYNTGVDTASLAVDIYHFDRPTAPGGAGFGIRVFDASGQPTFNSSDKPAVVLGQLSTVPQPLDDSDFPNNMPQPLTLALGAGRVGAAILNGRYSRSATASGTTLYDLVTLMRTYSGGVEIFPENLWNLGTASAGTDIIRGANGGLVIDVTGY